MRAYLPHPACPTPAPPLPRSFYLVGALSTLGIAALLTAGMVLSFDGLERREVKQALAAPAAHAAAALLTLSNFADGGCMVSVPLLLAGGGAMAAWAGRVWWQRTTTVPRLLVGGRRGAASARDAGDGSAGGDAAAGIDRDS